MNRNFWCIIASCLFVSLFTAHCHSTFLMMPFAIFGFSIFLISHFSMLAPNATAKLSRSTMWQVVVLWRRVRSIVCFRENIFSVFDLCALYCASSNVGCAHFFCLCALENKVIFLLVVQFRTNFSKTNSNLFYPSLSDKNIFF